MGQFSSVHAGSATQIAAFWCLAECPGKAETQNVDSPLLQETRATHNDH